ncbi:hypothetical protein Ade02nite_88810 [Paractinoplanes deccanensis]|uniref:PucR family transcriptional regulator n=1 Tax=Paractinoplanes deccanensis TaxID=113561 RepID=A0ABQ3YJR1_9ACTN|nr:helix-turn-helix domain-containing protein [Actinoplanes deccanensis]GID80240.1 hypothetical protein Ade02nite_88810 [Actinoplanes deccanensis]
MTYEAVVLMKDGEALAHALGAVLDAVAPDAVDAALLSLRQVAGDLGVRLDTRSLAAAAHRAAGRQLDRRGRQLAVLATNEALADLGKHDDLGDLRNAIVASVSRLVPEAGAVWLTVRDGGNRWRKAAGHGPDGPSSRGSLRVPLTDTAALHVAFDRGESLSPVEAAMVERYARAATLRLATITDRRDAERRNGELTTRLSTLANGRAMLGDLLGLAVAELPPLPGAVAQTLAGGLGAVVALLDHSARLVAAHPATPVAVSAPDLVARAAAEPGEVVLEPGSSFRYAVSVAGAGRTEGTVVVVRGSALSGDELIALAQAARVVGLMRLRHNALLQAYEETRTDLLGELLSARRASPRPVRVLAEARGFPLDRRCVVVAVAGDGSLDRVVADVAGRLGGLGGRHDGQTVVLLPGDDPRDTVGTLTHRLLRVAGTAPGMCASDPVAPADGSLPEAFAAARHGLTLLRAAGAANGCATTRDLALYRPLFDAERPGDLRELLDEALRPLTEYQRRHGIDLAETVHVFFSTGGNARQAARQMFIHSNTMAKRLDRVTRLLGAGWQEGADGLRLRLALHLRSLGAEHLRERAS